MRLCLSAVPNPATAQSSSAVPADVLIPAAIPSLLTVPGLAAVPSLAAIPAPSLVTALFRIRLRPRPGWVPILF